MEPITGALQLKPGREKPVENRHPWVFSGAIREVEGPPAAGDVVAITAADGRFLALGLYNSHSQIRARIIAWEDVVVDEAFWRARLARAFAAREALALAPETNAYRLVYAESDGVPGLIVDRYGDYLVVQCLTLPVDRRKEMFFDLLEETLQPAGIVERSDASVREKEGLAETAGQRRGDAPPDGFVIFENRLPFAADVLAGHKTGLYLDQRDNRALVAAPHHVRDRQVLNVFAYTGGFAVYAAAAGAARIVNVDSSVELLQMAETNVLRVAPERDGDEYIAGDAFEVLRYYRDTGRTFDVVIADPPKFAHSKGDLERASRGYKDINWLSLRLLRPGGLLATFSCSGLVSGDLFQKIVFGAAVDAARDVQIIHPLSQAADHPILLTFPESAYLKGLLCRVW